MKVRNIFHIGRCILISALIFITSPAWSANYYVDFVSGADTNNGTSTSTPFKHCPGDSNATSIAASKTLVAGDKIIFKGGVEYDGTININWSGTSGNPIIYDGNSAGTFGTGKALVSGQGTRNTCFTFNGSKSYVTINYFEIAHGKQEANAGRLVYDATGSPYITVSNNIIHDAGYLGDPAYGYGGHSGVGIWMNSSTHWNVYGNTIYDCYDSGIIMQGSPQYNSIHHNMFTDKIGWAIYYAIITGTGTDNYIYNNTFHDIYWYDLQGPHVDFIFVDVIGSGQANNTHIYNNLFYNKIDWSTTCSGWPYDNSCFGGTAYIYSEVSGENGPGGSINNLYVYNNAFVNTHSHFGISMGGNNIYFLNNSFWGEASHAVAVGGTNIHIENNIFYQGLLGGNLTTFTDTGTPTINYNLYDTPSDAVVVYNGTRYGFSAWKAVGFETNGLFGDPKFTNTSPTTHDMALTSSSRARGAGINLSSLCTTMPNLCYDINGVARPPTGAWDMGAYKYGSGS